MVPLLMFYLKLVNSTSSSNTQFYLIIVFLPVLSPFFISQIELRLLKIKYNKALTWRNFCTQSVLVELLFN